MATAPTVEAILYFQPMPLRLIKTRLAFRVADVGSDPVVAWHLGCCDVIRRKAGDGRPSCPALLGRSAEPSPGLKLPCLLVIRRIQSQ